MDNLNLLAKISEDLKGEEGGEGKMSLLVNANKNKAHKGKTKDKRRKAKVERRARCTGITDN